MTKIKIQHIKSSKEKIKLLEKIIEKQNKKIKNLETENKLLKIENWDLEYALEYAQINACFMQTIPNNL